MDGTPFEKIFKPFLKSIADLRWALEEEDSEIIEELISILERAVFKFKNPKVGLNYDANEEVFENDLGNQEIQMLVILMREEYRIRELDKWENNAFEYEDVDNRRGSKANFVSKLQENIRLAKRDAVEAYSIYDRSRDDRPLRRLAGGG